jgi:methylthioribose-1-phosphate isomerase
MRLVVGQPHRSPIELKQALLQQAKAIHEEDRQMCRQIGMHGSQLIADGAKVITHCNAGGLATSEYGTALAVLYTCQDQGKHIQVYADETRPLWQGARLTAWELTQRGIETTIICDSMAAHLMQTQQIDAVIVGADRITSRGDTANKIGTYALAIAAKFHHVPFYVAAPSSTFDFSLVEGQQIPIEQRSADEVTRPNGMTIGPAQAAVFNPAFDITPAELITAIVTEKGIIQPVDSRNIALILKSGISS